MRIKHYKVYESPKLYITLGLREIAYFIRKGICLIKLFYLFNIHVDKLSLQAKLNFHWQTNNYGLIVFSFS